MYTCICIQDPVWRRFQALYIKVEKEENFTKKKKNRKKINFCLYFKYVSIAIENKLIEVGFYPRTFHHFRHTGSAATYPEHKNTAKVRFYFNIFEFIKLQYVTKNALRRSAFI